MQMPGFFAESVFAPPGTSARQTGGGSGRGPVIVGTCECTKWQDVCIGGKLCIPFLGCTPSIEFCWQQCVVVTCGPKKLF
jgi:hypothetical protein